MMLLMFFNVIVLKDEYFFTIVMNSDKLEECFGSITAFMVCRNLSSL
jgi:hypothetical protein